MEVKRERETRVVMNCVMFQDLFTHSNIYAGLVPF